MANTNIAPDGSERNNKTLITKSKRISPRDRNDVAEALEHELWTASDARAAELDDADWLDWPAEVPA